VDNAGKPMLLHWKSDKTKKMGERISLVLKKYGK